MFFIIDDIDIQNVKNNISNTLFRIIKGASLAKLL
jgi:hypothetical protein